MSTSATHLLDVNLEGQLLIAMPGMPDERFARSVICVCAHSDEGAMGLIINKQADDLSFGALLEYIDLGDEDVDLAAEDAERPVYNGGPVESSRGFVLHSPDYFADGATVTIAEGICLTATTDILKAIALGKGPNKLILALGYSGWAPGQLESEIAGNGWLTCAADAGLVFDAAMASKHAQALAKLGIDPSHLVSTAGRA